MVLDPLSALSVGSNVIQLIDFMTKLVSKSQQLYTSVDGALFENQDLEATTERLVALNKVTDALPRTSHKRRRQFDEAVKASSAEADKLLGVLHKLKVRPIDGRWKSFQQAINSVWNQEKIDELSGRLQRHREEIIMHMLVSIRFVSPLS
jgi:hypothetical protein